MTHWKLTRSGTAFDLANPKPEMVVHTDIATGLSRIPRWCGQTRRVISVAQHSIHVSRRVFELTGDRTASAQGLVHEPEWITGGDIPTPYKDAIDELALQAGTETFRAFEARILRVIFQRFDLPWPMHPAVKQADREMFATEAHQQMPASELDYYDLDDVLDIVIPAWSAAEARLAFLKEGQTLGLW